MQHETSRRRGRPPAFDFDTALEAAMRLFRAHGYEGTSMTELTTAMGMNKASIYAAFGSKEDLFRKALERYRSGPAAFVTAALAEPTARKVVQRLLVAAAESLTEKDQAGGCMIVQGALTCGTDAQRIQAELAEHRRAFEQALVRRFERAKREKDLPDTVDCEVLGKLVATVHQGMSVQASSGASRKGLLNVVHLFLAQFPGTPKKKSERARQAIA